MKRVLLIIMAAMIVTSCYKSELCDITYPDMGKMVVNKILPDDATPPADGYTIIFNGDNYTTNSTTTTINAVIEPGVYTLYVYNNTSEMSIESDISESGEGTITSSKIVDAGMVRSLTEDLYFGTQTVTVLADEIIYSEVTLSQVTRIIKFNLNLTEGNLDDIVAVTASLGGIAGQWECIEDIPIGNVVTIAPDFIQGESLTKATANDYLTSSIKVLGINGDKQALNLELTFTNGNTQSITSDVSDQLTGSNDTKSTPITLSGNLKVNTAFGATGTITYWVVSEGEYDFDANQPNE